LIIADNVHGESGLDGPALPEPSFAPQSGTAVELMAKTLRESAQPVTIVSTGPQTNVALLLNSHPELHTKIARIVIMGGAMALGLAQQGFTVMVIEHAAPAPFVADSQPDVRISAISAASVALLKGCLLYTSPSPRDA
ncbi:nucleoside hydrolase, partial [Staphylococcus aureus]|nr:nucleoside hydrolase [Staphylococcus aureus]